MSSPLLCDHILSDTHVCSSLGEQGWVSFLVYYTRICRLFRRQRGLVYFRPYPMLYKLIVLFYTVATNIMQCTIGFVFYFIKGRLI